MKYAFLTSLTDLCLSNMKNCFLSQPHLKDSVLLFSMYISVCVTQRPKFSCTADYFGIWRCFLTILSLEIKGQVYNFYFSSILFWSFHFSPNIKSFSSVLSPVVFSWVFCSDFLFCDGLLNPFLKRDIPSLLTLNFAIPWYSCKWRWKEPIFFSLTVWP